MQFVIGIDIGGTGIQIKAFAVNHDGMLNPKAQYEAEETTQPGVDAHIAQIVRMIAAARKEITKVENDEVVGVGIASPGRFDASGCIKAGTNPNVGQKHTEFDGENLQARYKEALASPDRLLPLVVRNDADAMQIGLTRALQQSKTEFRDQKGNVVKFGDLKGNLVGYLGIGTGLGSSFARDDVFVNDGHLSKIIIEIDAEDLLEMQKVHDQRGSGMQYFAGNEANLESLVCNPTLCVLAGVKDSRDLDVNNENHRKALALVGKYIARGMIAVKKGNIRDINPENQWTPEEIEEAKQTSVYLLGGGIMGSTALATAITAAAEHELCAEHKLCKDFTEEHGIRIVPMGCENPAVLAAAYLLPVSERLGSVNPVLGRQSS
jgi:hypothetical protein